VLVKAESLQHTGSFKIRGALNRLLMLSHDEREAGVVAFSSGNHAQGVAMAAQWLGMPATIVMPEDAPKIKQLNTRMLGAEIVLYNRARDDREKIAADIASQRGAALTPAFDHPDVIAGQGTVGLELAEFARRRRLKLEGVFVPCGGGGLIAGSGLAIKSAFPDCELLAVEPDAYDDTRRSLEAGSRQVVAGHPRSSCDALMAQTPGAITFAINRSQLQGAVTVSDEQARRVLETADKVEVVIALSFFWRGNPTNSELVAELIRRGKKVILVERTPSLGGRVPCSSAKSRAERSPTWSTW